MNIVHKPICKCVTTCRYWSRLEVRPRQQQRIKARPLLQLMTSVNPEARRSLKSILPSNKRESVEAFSARSLPCFGLSRLLVHDNSLLGTQRALEESCDAKGKKKVRPGRPAGLCQIWTRLHVHRTTSLWGHVI